VKNSRDVIVKRLPEQVTLNRASTLHQEVLPFLQGDRPSLVFDFSDVRQIDSAGIEMLLRCVEQAMKSNGDVKLAALTPQVEILLRMTRVDVLFEVFDRPEDAVESFDRLPVEVLGQLAGLGSLTATAGSLVTQTSESRLIR
jgi:anti-sigma B factor antagonist